MAKQKARTGRPCELTPEVQAAIAEALANGAPRYQAAGAAGVSWSAFKKWMAAGRRRDPAPHFVAFVAAVKKAESEFVTRHAAVIARAADKSWQAAAWLLERRHPERYGADRREIAALLRRVADLEKELSRGRGGGADRPEGDAGRAAGPDPAPGPPPP